MLNVTFVTVCNIMAASKGLQKVRALLRELMSSGRAAAAGLAGGGVLLGFNFQMANSGV